MPSTQPLILIVEDEPKLASVLMDYLIHNDMRAHWVNQGLGVIDWVKQHKPDLMVLDLMLPERDGLSIYRELRTFSMIPVIMATAKVTELDRLRGLELGADDYICKPYSQRELVARIKNILRRTQVPLVNNEMELISTDPERLEAKVKGQALDLTPFEFRLLHYLVQHPERVYSRAQLLDQLYEPNHEVSERVLDSHIKNLRRKLEQVLPEHDLIRAVYGVGYKWVI